MKKNHILARKYSCVWFREWLRVCGRSPSLNNLILFTNLYLNYNNKDKNI